jgi:hypothetical protein
MATTIMTMVAAVVAKAAKTPTVTAVVWMVVRPCFFVRPACKGAPKCLADKLIVEGVQINSLPDSKIPGGIISLVRQKNDVCTIPLREWDSLSLAGLTV